MINHRDTGIGWHTVPYNDDYQTCERTCVEFRIYSKSIPPWEISSVLGIEPSSSVLARDWPGPIAAVNARRADRNGWFLSSEGVVFSKDSRRHFDWLLDTIEPACARLTALRAMGDVSMCVVCVWWARYGDGGPTLWPKHMARLALLDLELGYEFAYYQSDEPE